jgi:hypothetical protein
MEPEIVALLEKAYTNPKTRENYISRLRGLVDKMNVGVRAVLEDPDTYYPLLQKAYTSITTRKNILTALLIVLREDEYFKGKEALRAKWKKLHDNLGRFQDAKVKRSEPEEKKIAKYTSYEEIEAKYEELRNKGPHATRRQSLQFLLLSILVHLRPKRADLGAVQIFQEDDPNRTDINYLVLRKKGASFLAMNLYKTSKHYRKIEEDMPEGLVRDIQQSIKRWPRTYLFVKGTEDEPMSNNTYTYFVQRTFEALFGRGTGVSLLRHIYISEKLNFDDMTLEEQEEEARLMMHTSGLQRQYKWPKKTICPQLCKDYLDKDKDKGTRRAKQEGGRRRTRRQAKSRPSLIEHL